MKSIKYIIFFLLISSMSVFAQDETASDEPDNRPVRSPFESGTLIDNQTFMNQQAKTLESVIEHRFGLMNANGISDVYGIYAPSNIRLGINYNFTDRIMVGYGYTKDRKLMDFRTKISLINQTRSGSMPVGVAFYGNMGVTCVDEESFGEEYKFSNRLSYFGELMVGRKFNEKLSLQVSGHFSHLNSVDSLYEHDKIGISFTGRYKFSSQSSVMLCYTLPLELENMYESKEPLSKPKPNLGIGWEISTGTHVFQIFAGTGNTLSPQYNMMENQNDWKNGEMMLGFTMTRLWNF